MVDERRWSLTDQPSTVVDLRLSGSLAYLSGLYGGSIPHVLNEVLAQAFALGAQTAVIEYRYLDADYRDEHSRFYSTTFRRYPSVAHRIHFFRDAAGAELDDRDKPVEFAQLGYLGYAIMRPVPGAPVGRVMLTPPDDLIDSITCLAEETVTLLGEALTVRGTPFLAQDAQLARCAHAALWVVSRHHHLSWGTPRHLPTAIVDAAPADSGIGRQLPSPGLMITQLSAAASGLGLPPVVHDLDRLPQSESLARLVCRYLNSGFPVVVGGGGHAFVLVGYRRQDEGTANERIEFIRQDDEAGPYQLVPDFVFDTYRPWKYLIVPLPPKLYVTGDSAEAIARRWVPAVFGVDQVPLPANYALRSTALRSNAYKTHLAGRGIPLDQATALRRASMSKWIWVIEVVDRDLRIKGLDCVVGEVILDATDHDRDFKILASRTPNSATVYRPDTDTQLTAPSKSYTPAIGYVSARLHP